MRIEAQEGYVFAKIDLSAVFGDVIYLGIYDSRDNYVEITVEQAEEITRQLKEAEIKAEITEEYKDAMREVGVDVDG